MQPPMVTGALTATLRAPATAERGRHLDYTVTLTNDSDQPWHFDECPAYLQTLGSGGDWQRLNCAADIPARGSADFAIRMRVDPDTAAGSTRLRWLGVLADGTVTRGDAETDGVPIEVR